MGGDAREPESRRGVTFVLRDEEAEAAATCFRCCQLGEVAGLLPDYTTQAASGSSPGLPTSWKPLLKLESVCLCGAQLPFIWYGVLFRACI